MAAWSPGVGVTAVRALVVALGQMRHLVVSMILATDNAVHGQVLTEYTDRLQRIGEIAEHLVQIRGVHHLDARRHSIVT